MILIAGDGGEGEGESVLIQLRMEEISSPGKRVEKEQYMVVRRGTERTNAIYGGKGATE